MITEAQLHTKPTVLYIDDEAYNLIAFKASFRNYYTVYTAESAREAIEILHVRDFPPPTKSGGPSIKSIIKSVLAYHAASCRAIVGEPSPLPKKAKARSREDKIETFFFSREFEPRSRGASRVWGER